MGKDLKGKELGVGISQRKDGKYTARFTDKLGKRQQKYFKKLQECRNWIAEAQFQDEHGSIAAWENMTVDSWFEYWLNEIKGKNIRTNTRISYEERYKNSIKENIGQMLLSEVKPMHCQNVLNKMVKKYKTSTIGVVRGVMFGFFQSAVENDVISSNPIRRSVRIPSGGETKERRVLSIDEQRRFLDAAKKSPHYNQYAFVLQTGLRVGELMALRWEDIDLKNKIMSINHSMDCGRKDRVELGETKSRAGKRKIPLTNEAVFILKEQKRKLSMPPKSNIIQMEFADFVFLNERGRLIMKSAYNSSLLTVARRAGIERLSMHTLRHTFATRCIEAGMKPKTLQMILGHSKISMTMDLYVHVTEDEKEKELRNIEKMLKLV